MTVTADRNTAAAPATSIPTELWEMVRSGLETSVWAQDQLDTLTRAWLDQARVTRHDGLRVAQQLMGQAKSNQEEMIRLFETNLRHSMSWVPDSVTFANNR